MSVENTCDQKMKKLHLLIANTNWELLRQQKMALLRIVGNRGAFPPNQDQLQLLNGLMIYLDALQDWAVDVYGLSEAQVFGLSELIKDCEDCLDSTSETCI